MSRDLHYILINICSASAATVVRQQGAPETTTASRPSRSYTKRFTTCWYKEYKEVARYELENGQALPDTVKIAILLNETKGAVQQHQKLQRHTYPWMWITFYRIQVQLHMFVPRTICISWCIYTTTLHSYRSKACGSL